MCFGSKSKSAPAPAQPTTFKPMPDEGMSQQQKIASENESPGQGNASLGSDLAAPPSGPMGNRNYVGPHK